MFETKESNSYYSSYQNDLAIFTSLLLDVDSQKYIDLINNNIDLLYQKDWNNYYYSTKTKANVFLSFYKFLEKY
jgi:hypothetical protein